MAAISFNLESWDGRKLVVGVSHSQQRETLVFGFDEPTSLNEENLAVALSTLCGTRMDHIHFGFSVNRQVMTDIAEWTKAEVTSEGTKKSELAPRVGNGVALNFSGGLDSLAAKYLLPGDTQLVSLDFGGRFARERAFFNQFGPRTISTNLIDTTLRSHSWSFMGIGALLLAEELSASYLAFGSIIEAAQLRLDVPRKKNITFPAFKIAGFENASPVAGVSEAGTVQIILRQQPELLCDSLRSLANPGEEKYYRKIALATVVADLNGIDIMLPSLPSNQRVHYKFGQNFAVDLTALFFEVTGRPDFAASLVESIPSDLRRELRQEDFSFMLKVDQNYYGAYPETLRAGLDSGLAASDLDWYSDSDYEGVHKIRELMSTWYQF